MRNNLKLLSASILMANATLVAAQNQPPPASPDIEEVVTIGQYIPDEKRATAAISNVIDAEAFAAAGDSSVADGLKRVSGLNLQGGKFIYIRGLGERYSSTVLNGSTLPSPEPINRVVPLDLFPTNIIESVLVQKTFSAQYPAEFAGGTIQMRTRIAPDQPFFSVSTSVGYSGNTTGEDGLVYSGGGDDWMGTDDGTRDIPDLLKSAIAGDRELKPNTLIFRDGFDREELEVIGESLSNNYTVKSESIKPDFSASANFGTSYYMDNNWRLGLLGNLSYSNSWDTIEVSRNNYAANSNGELSTSDELSFRSTEQSVDTSTFLAAGIEFSDLHSLQANVLQIRKMDDLAGNLTGFQNTESVFIDQNRLEWIERDLLSTQLQGQHIFDTANELTINWHYNESRAKREAPDMRQYRYDYDPNRDAYLFSLRADANTRRWDVLEDQNKDLGFNANMFLLTPFDTSTTLAFGATSIGRERDSDLRRFSFISQGALSNNQDLLSRPLDEVISPATIAPNGFQLRESTRPTDNYVATQNLDAWYVEADIELNYMFRLLAGVRHEESIQNVQTFDLFNTTAPPILSELSSDDYFPVVTGTMILDRWDMQVRASYSETISRPDFRELSPAPFTHPVTGFIIVGNADLDVTYIKNYDARWEWYFSSDESLSIGLFYKDFSSPIEAVIKPGEALERSFINAQDANVYGIEFDTYKYLDFVNEKFENFYFGGNLTLLKSEVNIRPQDSGIITNATRALQGQADYIVNLQLGYDDGFVQKGSFVYHITGPKIREVGVLKAPDVMDEAYGELDFAYTRFFGDTIELNVKVKNILNQDRETTQGGLDVNTFREGTSASLGLTYNF